MKNLKSTIEEAAKHPLIEALQLIADASAIRNDPLRVAFYGAHCGKWHAYTIEHRENILADYVAELQTPQFSGSAMWACPQNIAVLINQLHEALNKFYTGDFSYNIMARGNVIAASDLKHGHVKPTGI